MASMTANAKLALTSLNVSGNVIEEKGLIRYIFVLKTNTAYQRISLLNNLL